MSLVEFNWGRLRYVLGAAIVVAAFLALGTASSHAAAPKALILGSTVSAGRAPDGDSLEQEAAENAGFTVTVVSDSTWDSMTAAQFRSYQLLILGDPTCSGDPSSPDYQAAQNNMSVWEPVVMSSGGNKVLIGTDPVFHEGSEPGALKLINQGVAFAGAASGATGLYLDLSCSYDSTAAGTPVPIMDGLSTHGPHQFTAIGEGAVNACATGVNIVAATGPTAGLKDADLSNWGCSVHEAFDKFPTDWTPLAIAPSSSGFPTDYCAKDVETKTTACGSPYIMVSGSGISVSSDITLSPSKQTQDLKGNATLTATVVDSSGKPVSGTTVTLTVDSGPDAGFSATAKTDSSGHATFSYSNSKATGTDNLTATFTNAQGAQERATASVTWEADITAQPGPAMKGKTGQTLSGTEATFFDANTSAKASDYTATIKWGDGKKSTGTITSTGGGNFTVTGKHAYSKAGTFTITVTITDVDTSQNTATVTTTATITSSVVHGKARLSGAPSACTLRPVTLRVTGSRISSVKWTLDGKSIGGKTVKRGKKYSARFSVSSGKHSATARVTFKKSSQTKARTFHRTITGCAPVLPKFTG